ncbi:uncharacterized protein LOC113305577 [Papaver somniferum]|uniref:uncharacterized protein LOC113305577 n=1 Tax=Papaver somniferum TaxID=3469 RepID=UPI000E6FD17B|nr:uncharacterized protein LOC113305577 [Papaver somniferum]
MVYLDATFLTGRFIGCLMTATGINGDKGYTNLPTNGSDPRYSLVIDHFQEATYALSYENHAKAIQKIRDLNCDWVADYIHTIPPESYVNTYFKGCRYGYTSSTLGESFNSWILVHKKMPTSAFLDQIRMKVMVMMADRHEDGANMMTPLTPEYEKRLEALQDEGLDSQDIECVASSYTIYMHLKLIVTHLILHLWCVYGFPCAHALAAIREIKREAIYFISPYFTSNYFRKTYLHVIQPIPNYNRPADICKDDIIIPPIVNKQPGRPHGKRIESKGENNGKGKVCCSNCTKEGHNMTGCQKPPKYTPPLYAGNTQLK